MTPRLAIADDFDEMCPICHSMVCDNAAHQPPPTSDVPLPQSRPVIPAARFRCAADLINEPRSTEIVEGIAWANCITLLASESGAGKTFVLLDLVAAVSAGLSWHGRTTLAGSVAYVSYEGDALGLRLRVLEEAKAYRLDHVFLLRATHPLSPRTARDGTEERSVGELLVADALTNLAAQLSSTGHPPVVLVVIDTVRASLAGSEDNSGDVSGYLRAGRRLMTCVPKASAILAHHAGWQDGETQRKRERGSSAWRGNCDATLYLEAGEYDAERHEAPLILRALKVRDAERPAPLHLLRRRVELAEWAGADLRHGPVTSCVIEADRRTHADRDAEQQQMIATANQAADLAVLRAMHDYPDATCISKLRRYVGLRNEVVSEAVARILRAGWAKPGTRNRPYCLTDDGRAQLNHVTS